ncbi:hypothetical protein JCM19047_2490 [Bacillus sp. JCM 19047]|nr:hypothetical protein JCM19047_2490 [Bacillus sp. JCM 19047]
MDFKALLQKKTALTLGDKRVDAQKLTYNKYKKMQDYVQNLPGNIFSLMLTPQEDFYQTALVIFHHNLNELYDVVSVLSEIDREYLDEHAGVNEVVDYLVATVKANDFQSTLKKRQEPVAGEGESSSGAGDFTVEQWLIESALILGVTQYEIENEYDFVDLPEILATKRRLRAIDRLQTEQSFLSTNNRALGDEDSAEYRRNLMREAGVRTQASFDREKFEEARNILASIM